jgi:uncharacterized integral membrane protein
MTSHQAIPEMPDPQPSGPPFSGSTSPPAGAPQGTSAAPKPRTTRAGVVWAAVVIGLLALILLIIFILQNQQPVDVLFLGLAATVPLGMALFIAAVAGGVLVAAAGAARIIQLRTDARKIRKTHNKPNPE